MSQANRFKVALTIVVPGPGSGRVKGEMLRVMLTCTGAIPHFVTLRDGSTASVDKVFS